jgi:hypothetical protein
VARAEDAEPPKSEAVASLEKAAASGEEVEVVGAREEYTTTHANPDGYSFTLTQSAVPQSSMSSTPFQAGAVRRAPGLCVSPCTLVRVSVNWTAD